jgi:hypothetical protein
MANPTTNFGWVMPSSSSLVTNLPADFNTFGQAVDTSMAELKGGTTGQVLSKTSNTDMDFTWIANDVGDITGVTAGTGLTGGGTSGTVTVALDATAVIAPTIVDAKGDLIAGTAADAVARLAVGTNGQILTADSTAATGMKWATSSSSSGPAFSAYRGTSNQSITQNTYTKVQLNTEYFDGDNCFDSTTNYRFTPTTAGKYQMNVVALVSQSAAARLIVVIYKNGTAHLRVYDNTTSSSAPTGGASTLIDMNGTTDYLELYVYSAAATQTVDAYSSGAGTVFSGAWIRS